MITPQEAGDLPHQPKVIQKICHRNYGVGADGVLIGPVEAAKADFGLRIFNPDGSEAEKSGNGLRIFSRWLWDNGLVSLTPFTVWTPGGTVEAQILNEGKSVKVDMGRAIFDSQQIPISGPPRQVIHEKLEVEGKEFIFCAVSLGNPHCVIHCDQVKTDQVRQFGPRIERDTRFPNRTNVQFMQVLDRQNIYIEIWERGAGYTLSSGSSSCAAAATAFRLGLCDPHLTVHMPGGEVDVSINENYQVTLTGPVTFVARGEIADELFSDKIPEGDTT